MRAFAHDGTGHERSPTEICWCSWRQQPRHRRNALLTCQQDPRRHASRVAHGRVPVPPTRGGFRDVEGFKDGRSRNPTPPMASKRTRRCGSRRRTARTGLDRGRDLPGLRASGCTWTSGTTCPTRSRRIFGRRKLSGARCTRQTRTLGRARNPIYTNDPAGPAHHVGTATSGWPPPDPETPPPGGARPPAPSCTAASEYDQSPTSAGTRNMGHTFDASSRSWTRTSDAEAARD